MQDTLLRTMDRRSVIKWIVSATASISMIEMKTLGQSSTFPKGYGTDPNLLAGEVPWDLTMTDGQLRTTSALADLILPRIDKDSPSATEVGVPSFLDEWISAPYPDQERDRAIILGGLSWIDEESQRRFGKQFVDLVVSQQKIICDDICYLPDVSPEFASGARFFSNFRNLTLGGYYTTYIGMRDVGYVGNVALNKFEGPPPEVLRILGIDKAPW